MLKGIYFFSHCYFKIVNEGGYNFIYFGQGLFCYGLIRLFVHFVCLVRNIILTYHNINAVKLNPILAVFNVNFYSKKALAFRRCWPKLSFEWERSMPDNLPRFFIVNLNNGLSIFKGINKPKFSLRVRSLFTEGRCINHFIKYMAVFSGKLRKGLVSYKNSKGKEFFHAENVQNSFRIIKNICY